MKTLVFCLACIFSLMSVNTSFAREPVFSIDSVKQIKRNPDIAIICSAVLPGLGQVYDRKYWKVPLVYGAGGAALYSVDYYHRRYKKIMGFLNEGDENKTLYKKREFLILSNNY